MASSATSITRIMSSTWASVVPAGKVPKDTTPTTSTASLPVLARRFLADPHEIGRFEGIGPDLWELGAAATRASVGREPVTAEDCGSDCGAASRTGRERLRGSSPPDSTERALIGSGPTPIRAGEGLRAPVAMVVSPRPERAGQADQDGRPSGAARAAIDLSVVRGVGSSTVVRGSVGSYRPVIAGAKLREGITTILPRGESAPGSRLVFNALSPHWRGTRRRQRRTRSMVHGKNRIPYRIDRRLTGLAGPDYAAPISFGLPIEPEDSQYGESRF